MKRIKPYLGNWSAMRSFRVIMAVILGIAYFNTHEVFFLIFAIALLLQAIFNMSCPGGSCGTENASENKPTFKFKKYEPKN